MILALFSATVFAAPGSMVLALDNSDPAAVGLAGSQGVPNEAGDLFADVQAMALTREEAQCVEGEGTFLALGASVVMYYVAPVIAKYAYQQQILSKYTPQRAQMNSTL